MEIHRIKKVRIDSDKKLHSKINSGSKVKREKLMPAETFKKIKELEVKHDLGKPQLNNSTGNVLSFKQENIQIDASSDASTYEPLEYVEVVMEEYGADKAALKRDRGVSSEVLRKQIYHANLVHSASTLNIDKMNLAVDGKNFPCSSSTSRHTLQIDRPISDAANLLFYEQLKYTQKGCLNIQKPKHHHSDAKPFACNQCSYTCKRSRHLTIHKLKHTGEKPFACDACPFKCTDNMNLLRHKRIHSTERPYRCDQCSYTCNQKSHLTIHKLSHTGEKLFHCDQCSFGCNDNSKLSTHKLTHSGEKPFACDQCAYRSNRKSILATHKLRHTGEKPFACDQCDFRCNCRRNLFRHKRSHGDKPPSLP